MQTWIWILIIIVIIIITIVLTSVVWYCEVKSAEDGYLASLFEQYAVVCNPDAKIIYREAVYVPYENGVYEKKLATALYDICMSTSDANCIDPIPLPPNFSGQRRVMGIEPESNKLVLLACIFWNETMVVFAFTGTELRSEWMSDLDFKQTAPTKLNGYEEGILVHEGFYSLYLAIREKLWLFWKENPKPLLYITGHSLGGALSNLCAFDFGQGIQYSFGAPRTGNPKFAKVFNQRLPTAIRVNNTEDVVPELPPSNWNGYSYEQVGQSLPFTLALGSLAKNHDEAYTFLPECAEVAPSYVKK